MKVLFFLILGILITSTFSQPQTQPQKKPISEQKQIPVASVNGTEEPSILQKVREKYSAKTTFESDFTVTIYWAVREKQEKRAGRLLIAPGDKFRVESGNSVWVSDGSVYWQYNKKNNQVLIKRLLDVDISMLPSQLIAEYLTAFRYRAVQDMPERCMLEGRPDSANAQGDVASLLISIDKKNNTVSQILVADKDGNKSDYVFKNIRFGARIPRSEFSFTPPAGAAVIDARD